MNNVPAVRELLFENQPIHVFEYDGKVAFLAQEIGDVLGVKDVARGVRESKTLEKSVDYDVIPAYLIPKREKLSVQTAKHVVILYLSGFFLFVLRSNKDIAVPFTRWAIREAIPEAFARRQQKIPDLSEKTLVQLVKEERQGSGIARQVLSLHGWIDPMANRQLEFHGGDDEE